MSAMGKFRRATCPDARPLSHSSHTRCRLQARHRLQFPDVNASLVAKIALPALVRLGRSPKADTQCAALDALSVLGELPQVHTRSASNEE